MSVSDAQKAASAKWDKANMTILACRVTKAKAEKFKSVCKAQGLTPNAVLLKCVDHEIEKAEGRD